MSFDREFKVLLYFPWGKLTRHFKNGVVVSTDFSVNEADALLCWWQPNDDLLKFNGIKAWACEEPITQSASVRKNPDWVKITSKLSEAEIFDHFQENLENQITPIIYFAESPLHMNRQTIRRDFGVSIISNTGRLFYRGFDVRLRLRFAVNPRVDLYGKAESWARFRRFPWNRPRPPDSYRGECPGYWGSDEKIALMSRYKVAVCLENSSELNYFTEKFVDAVRAGCIPVYRAHPSVASGILQGAKWVDPAHFGFSVSRTLDFALGQDLTEYQDVNERWLNSDAVRERSFPNMLEKVCMTLWQRWSRESQYAMGGTQ